MASLDIPMVDELLLNTITGSIPDLGNIDIDKLDSDENDIPTTTSVNNNTTNINRNSPIVSSSMSPIHSSAASPMKVNSPHVTPAKQQQNQQQSSVSHQQQQRKVQLGPNFDRLGILNENNEVPNQMTAPFFAKALQQHGGTTLGAILQAHQHAIQQQMQRENFIMQQVQHPMFQNVPFNNLYQQQQQQNQQSQQQNQHSHQQPSQPQQRVNHPILIDQQQQSQQPQQGQQQRRRSDDQIVPNPQILPSPEHWLQKQAGRHQSHHQHQKQQAAQMKSAANIKQENMNNDKHKPSPEKYFIFNNESSCQESQQADVKTEDEQQKIMPPKNSVFVRYQTEANRRLPSFTEAFTNYIEKLKMKEQYLKAMFHQQGINAQQLQANPFYRQMLLNQHMQQIPFQFHQIPQVFPPMFQQQLQQAHLQQQQQQQQQQHRLMRERSSDLEGVMRPEVKRQRTGNYGRSRYSHGNKHHNSLNTKSNDKDLSENITAKHNSRERHKEEAKPKQTTALDHENNNELEVTSVKKVNDIPIEDIKDCDILKIAAKNITEINEPEKTTDSNANNSFELDFLNDTNKESDEFFNFTENTDSNSGGGKQETEQDRQNNKNNDPNNTKSSENSNDPIEILSGENSRSSTKTEEDHDDASHLFGDDLQNNYDNLFNGNTDEHYFQAFKDNNLPLFTSLQEKTDANDEISKLLHSPLDFLNEKFLSS